jgi:hypothetical protein
LVDDEKVLSLRNGEVDESEKRDGASGLLIIPLHQALTEKMNRIDLIAARRQQGSPKRVALLVADKRTDYRLVSEVLYTAGQAQFSNFRFVAAEGG